ncbi:MAG: SDR family oxidoreductase [Asticcacaulis sp.]|uniref:SDR family NAD(P)-dependent oxidoreductase n=1 Tax=Asticcacaulis sp. TaxID=1872648 RepID=UPI0039E6679D
MTHPALKSGNKALITGGASGIGLAAAKRLATLGLAVHLVDLGQDRLKAASDAIAAEASVPHGVVTIEADISDRDTLFDLARQFPDIDVLMNNAAISGGGSSALTGESWQRVLDVNLWGVIHGTQAFAPAMVASGKPGLIINTGSKQGITTPPGNPAYNVSKAGVKAFTEALQHELRNGANPAVTAHLLIPGYVWTGMTQGGQTEKPAGAWTSEETIDFMLESVGRGDFYILCPDNDVPRALDEKRMAWAIGDVIENRPPLSRWHPDYADAFKAFVEKK